MAVEHLHAVSLYTDMGRHLQPRLAEPQPNAFVGTWRLVSCNAHRRNGQILPIYGPNPEGRLFYDAAGNMSVHIMQAGRPPFKEQHKFRASDAEMRLAYQGYEAYFSTYEIDAEGSVIHHRVLGGLFPNWTGSVQSRCYRFDGPDRLILSTEPLNGAPPKHTVVVLTWERLS